MMLRRLALGWLLMAALCPSEASAEQPKSERVELRHDASADLFILGTGVYVSVLFQLAINADLAPTSCRWCTPPSFDVSARKALLWSDTRAATSLGNLGAFVLSPVSALGLTSLAAADDDRADEIWVDDIIIVEATTTTIALTQVVKPLAGRARPAVYYETHDWRSFPSQEVNGSFFSGHSSTAFALAVSSGTVASLRGYRLAPLVWAVGLPIAAFTAYSRIAADAHWLSDVVVGSTVGAAVGFSMPYFLHSPEPGEIAWHPAPTPVAGGAALGVGGIF